MKKYWVLNMLLGIISWMFIQSSQLEAQTRLLIRCDDIGMCHSVNLAAKQLIAAGVPFSASVMFACPWYLEAVEILKTYPHVSVGVHLTLNSEWKNYKWGPILGKEIVPSLVDSNGHFFASEEQFQKSNFKIEEIERELRAQIERALHSGLHIDYLDHHMGTAASTSELRSLVEKLDREYKLGISRYFDEAYQTLWEVPPENKLSRLLEIVSQLQTDNVNLLVIHLGQENSEMKALIDLNYPEDPFRVSQHRQSELDALCSDAFEKALDQHHVKLVTYREIISQKGLKVMHRPQADPEY
jgi:predicted glycoside hydrolase/deacetylase ChbG (UPF0249 family)